MPLIVGEIVAQLGIEDNGYSDGMSQARGEAAATSTQITAAENRIRTSRSATLAANTRLQAAEAQLAALRASGNATAAQLTAAEARVTAARQAHTTAIARNAQATAALRAEQAAATTSTNALAAAAARARAALSTIGIGVGMAGAVLAIKQSVMAASDLAESTNKVDQLFGANAGKIKDWAAGAAQSLAMTNVEARDAASSMALYGQQANLTGDNLVNFSTKMTGLAADLASFSNTSPQEAVEALGAAFRGESDPIEQYGVLLNEDRLKQEALKAGLISTTSDALSPAIRVQAVYNSVLSQTTAQQGDFARTSDSFSNQLKIIKAEVINAAASFGEKLIPVAQILADVAAGLIPIIGGVVSIIGGAASVFNSLPGPIQAAVAAIVAFRIASHFMGGAVTGAVGRVTGAFTGLARTTTVMTNQGRVQMGQFGSAVAGMGRHVPTIARMQTSFLNAAQAANRFPRAAGAASAAMTGLKGAAGGLMDALGGPWGLAIAGATAALGFWMQKKSEDAAKSQEAKDATQEWADALLASKGAIDDSVRSLAVKKIAETNAYETADRLGISQQTLTDKVLAGREAYDAWFASLSASGKYERGDLAGLTGDIQRLATEVDNGRDKAVQMARANGDMAVSFDGGQQSAGAMSKAMTDFEESTDGAASKVDKLAKALSELRDDKLTQEEALQAWSDGIRDLAAAWTEAGAAAVKADGHIDVTTEKGSALQDAVVDQAKAYDQVGAAALETAKSQKMSAGDTLTYVQSKVAPMRKAFIDQAVAAGVPLAQARKLADTYLGLPEDIVTKLDLQGAQAAIDKLNDLHIKGAAPVQLKYTMIDNTADVRNRLDDVKIKYSIINGKVVINRDDLDAASVALGDLGVKTENLPDGLIKITDTSAENLAHLHDLGIKTQTLPNGTIVINPDDAAFWTAVTEAQKPGEKKIVLNPVLNDSQMQAVIAGIIGTPVTIPVVAGARPNAVGSITEYADGGVRPSGVPSMPSEAVIERGHGAGLVRWAEGETGWEAYIPGKKNRRSVAILREAASRLGYSIAPVMASYADGAIRTVSQVKDFARGVQGASYLRGGWGNGWTTDCSGAQSSIMEYSVGNTDIAGAKNRAGTAAFAQYTAAHGLKSGLPPAGTPAYSVGWSSKHTSGTIHDPSGGDVNVEMGGGNGGGAYGGGAVGSNSPQFPNHAWMPLLAGDGGTTGQKITLTKDSSTDDVARKIIQEGRTRGYSDDEIEAVLATAIQENGLKTDNVFQQDESYPGRDDPNTNISGFYDRLDKTKSSEGASDDIWKNIYWMQQRPGESTADAAVANGRPGYMSEIKSRDDDAEGLLKKLGPSVPSATDGTGTTTSGSGDGQRVYVTNWPGGYTTGSTTTSGDSGSKGSTTTTGDSGRKLLFILGGPRIYQGSPDTGTGTSDGGGKTTKGGKTPTTVADAKAAVAKATRDRDEAKADLAIAEQKLREVRANPKAKQSQIMSAEAKVTKERNDLTEATTKLTKAEKDLKAIQGESGAAPGKRKPIVKRQAGGPIPGVGRGDIIPMMGEPGEFVVRRTVAEKNRYALAFFNSTGSWPEHHQDGGTVGGFGGYQQPTIKKVNLLDRKPAAIMEDLYRLGVAGVGGAFMAGSAIGADGTFQGLSTGASTVPILDDMAQKINELVKEGRVGSIGIYVGEGGTLTVTDEGKMSQLRDTQDKAVGDALLRSAGMRR